MKPDQSVPPVAPGGSASSSEPPEGDQFQRLLKHVALSARRRERRRWLLGISAVAGGAWLLRAIVSSSRLFRHQPPPSKPGASEPAAIPRQETDKRSPLPSESSRAPSETAPSASGPERASSSPSALPDTRVSHQPHERLATLHRGDPKERVFDLFGATVKRQGGAMVQLEGMRLRARGQSPNYAQVEVAEVTLAGGRESGLYWFLFGDGRLLAWGRPDEWAAAVSRHRVEMDYSPTP
jgi:hypothetical protein